MPDFPDVLTLEQAAEYLQLNPRTVYDMARKGELPAVKVRNKWRFSRRALEEWVAGNGKTAQG